MTTGTEATQHLASREDTGLPRLLVAIDGSPSARDALEEAMRLARIYEAHITIITVTPGVRSPSSDEKPQPGQPAWPPDDDYLGLLREAASRVPKDITITTELARGPAAAAIVEHAHRGGHDLVVIGSHGLGGDRSLGLGSVSQRVLDDASVPVLIVRGKSTLRNPNVDQMGECSFPASDPPATWTWDVEPRVRAADLPAGPGAR
jgi:nucleotide-binding universal stress UspA family protein